MWFRNTFTTMQNIHNCFRFAFLMFFLLSTMPQWFLHFRCWLGTISCILQFHVIHMYLCITLCWAVFDFEYLCSTIVSFVYASFFLSVAVCEAYEQRTWTSYSTEKCAQEYIRKVVKVVICLWLTFIFISLYNLVSLCVKYWKL